MLPQTASKLQSNIAYFSGKLSHGLNKPTRRFIYEMIYGIQARQSVHLSEVARALDESIALIKTVKRLSENLARPALRYHLQDMIVREGSGRVEENTLLVLDISDVVKRYAKDMDHLARVRDGSEGELADGYWLCKVIGVENGGRDITPLYGELYSQEAEDFVSENREIMKAIGKVSRATRRRGIWVMDRGCDRGKLYKEVVPREKMVRFIVRQKGDRHVFFGNTKVPMTSVAAGCPLPYATTVVREETGKERVYTIEFGFRAIRLPRHPRVPLWLVVVRGFGEDAMMLLTNIPMRKNRKLLWWIVSAYITRWRIEETIRFEKQIYQLEDIRVRRYERLRNMVVLVIAAMYFATVVLGSRIKLKILSTHVLTAAKRLFGIPDFRYYAIADGIKEVFMRFPRGKAQQIKKRKPMLRQIYLFKT